MCGDAGTLAITHLHRQHRARRPLHHASKEVAEVVAANPGALDSQGAIAIIDETLIEESQRKLRRPTPRPYV